MRAARSTRRWTTSSPRASSAGRRSASARAARELAFYFYRICGAYILILIPAAIVSFLGRLGSIPIAGLFVSINPIATFCVILKKSDARRYIVELVTLSCVFDNRNNVGRKDEVVERTAVATILGFDITEGEDDSDSPGGDNIEANNGSNGEGMDAKRCTNLVGGTDTDLEGQYKEEGRIHEPTNE